MSQQGIAATQREPVLPRRSQRDRRDLAVQVTDRHQAAPAAAARNRG